MSFDAASLFALLPAIHRLRDGEAAVAAGLERGPMEELLAVFAEQIGVMDENLAQLLDDLFIETCAEWTVPYLGDLIGYQSLHRGVPGVASPRAEVAHTIALRRRKGTAVVLEQLARDVTGWDARVVEYFQRLAATQYLNHLRPHCRGTVDLRDGRALEWLGSAFDGAMRTVEVRRIESGRGRFNIPNVGLHLWRIQAWPHRGAPTHRAGPRRYRASPLGHDTPLYNRPVAEEDIAHLAEPDNVPLPLTRRWLARDLARHYGERASAAAPLDNPNPALQLWVDGTPVERDHIRICHLGDDGGGWAHTPPPDGFYSLDPVLGRIALPGDAPDPAEVSLTWQEGFSAPLGGGEYDRGTRLPVLAADRPRVRVPDDQPTLTAALAALAGDGVVEVTDNRRYVETLAVDVTAGGHVELRASRQRRPVLALAGFSVAGGEGSRCTVNGFLVTGAPLVVPAGGGNALARLDIVDCTLVPGLGLEADGAPSQPTAASLILELPGMEAQLAWSLCGAVRCVERATLSASCSAIDATDRTGVAYAGLDGAGPGGVLSLDATTVVGKVHMAEVGLISNSILFAALAEADAWSVPVRATRRQTGCVRFSWLPVESVVPARHRCQPASASAADANAPRFVAQRYGSPAYLQLAVSTPEAIARGADDEGEMGVFHALFNAQREANLRIRLAEYLRVGLEAGVFYES